jgi:O-methyltransferase involved in polyketide biosynthesis
MVRTIVSPMVWISVWPSAAESGRIVSEMYCQLPVDLRDIAGVKVALDAVGFDPALPTYVLSECVLIYMEPQYSAAVVRFFGSLLPSAVFVVYEQAGPLPLAPQPHKHAAPCSQWVNAVKVGDFDAGQVSWLNTG